jgi:predicted amidohydrolase YtcJ
MSEQDAGTPRKGLSRKQFVVGGAAAGAALGVGGAGATLARAGSGSSGSRTQGPDEHAEVVLYNGRIHTMDAQNRVVSGVVIRDGRFVEVDRGVPRDGLAFDLRGRTVVPGIIDNHNHIILMGNRPGYHTPLENAYSIDDVQAIYAARAAGIPAGAWITTIGGFHANQFAEVRLPTRQELDAAVPNNPAFILQGFTGPATTNSLGKTFFESQGVTVADNGAIATAGQQAALAMLRLRQTLLDPEQRRRGTVDAIAYGLGLGVTTHIDQGAFQKTNTPADGAAHEDNFTMQLPFLELHEEGELDARVQINFLHQESDLALPELKARLRNQFQFFGDDVLSTGGIGEFIASYPPGPSFVEAARTVAQAKWRAEVHSLGATDFVAEISAWEAANAEFPIGALRWVVAHVPFITEEWVNRLKAIGGGLSLTGWRYLAGTATQNGPPFRMIVDNGIPAGMSSDGMQIAPMNPWIHMYYATTGRNALGQAINAAQRITREEVLRLYTGANGWFLRMEDDLGTIEPGKLADLVVLDRDYFTVPDADLRQLRSVLTVVDGRVVHDDGSVRR